MSARDRGYDPRASHPRSGAHPVDSSAPAARRQPSSGGSPSSSRPSGPGGGGSGISARLVASVGAIAVIALVAIGFGGGFLGGGSSASRSPAGTSSAATGAGSTAAPAGSDTAAASGGTTDPGGSATPGDSAAPAPAASAAPTGPADVAFVPVTSFRTGRSSVRAADVRSVAAGTSPFASIVLVKDDAAAELKALGLDSGSLGDRLVQVASADALAASLAQHRTWLGFLRADQVGPSVRALALGSTALFGEGRVASLDAWPLHATLAVSADAAAYNPSAAWTLFAAGDLALDRGAALAIKKHGNNSNYLYGGGTVTITGHCPNCSPFGWDLPYTKRTGNAGAMRSLIQNADFSVANMEEVAVTNWAYHPHGTVFTGNPAYLVGIKNAGFDWVSMGNNHVGDFGAKGVIESMGYLTKAGLLHGGAGANISAAHKPTIVTAGGVKFAMLSYDTVAPVYNATATKAGSARMTPTWLRRDIKAARDAGAQVVIVWPHWGVEYTAGPSALQQRLAHAAIDAGADLVIGNHPHWAQAMEVYKGRPIWYALGNFTFDQTWSEPTMEGISLELTFSGTKLVQAWMHPHLVLDYAQPNLMDPMGAGKVVFDQIFKASKNLPW